MRINNIKNFLIARKADISFWLTLLIVITIPFKVNYGNISIILASIFTVLTLKKKTFKKILRVRYLFPIGFFLITIVSSVFSKYSKVGLARTDLELLPVLLVLIIANQEITKEKIFKLFNYFALSTLFFTLILIVVAIFHFKQDINSGVFHDFTMLYDQHPVYYSMYISLSLFYLILHPQKQTHKYFNLLKSLSYGLLILGLILCASKAIIFIDLVILIFLLLIKKTKHQLRYLILIIVLSTFLYNISFVKERFTDGLRFNNALLEFQPTNDFNKKRLFTYEEKEGISDLELRYVFLKIMLYHTIKDNKSIFGYGQGDTQNYIDYYLYSYNLGPNWYDGFNVHNQYLHLFITYGVFVLFLFLIYLFYSFKSAIKHSNYLFVVFLIISSFVFIFEVTLVRNKGLVFFYFFNTLFLANFINFENSNIRDKGNSKLPWWF